MDQLEGRIDLSVSDHYLGNKKTHLCLTVSQLKLAKLDTQSDQCNKYNACVMREVKMSGLMAEFFCCFFNKTQKKKKKEKNEANIQPP